MSRALSRVTDYCIPLCSLPPLLLYNNLSFCDKQNLLVYASRNDCFAVDTAAGETRAIPFEPEGQDIIVQCMAIVVPPGVVSDQEEVLFLATRRSSTQLRTSNLVLGKMYHKGLEGPGGCSAISVPSGTSVVHLLSGTLAGVVTFAEFNASASPSFVVHSGIKAHQNYAVTAAQISPFPDTSLFAVTGDTMGILVFWSRDRQPSFSAQLQESITALQIVSGGAFAVAALGSGKILMIDSETGKVKIEVCAHARWINVLAYNIFTNALLSAAEDGYITLWSAPTIGANGMTEVSPLATMHVPNALPTGAAFSADGTNIVVALYDLDVITQYRID